MLPHHFYSNLLDMTQLLLFQCGGTILVGMSQFLVNKFNQNCFFCTELQYFALFDPSSNDLIGSFKKPKNLPVKNFQLLQQIFRSFVVNFVSILLRGFRVCHVFVKPVFQIRYRYVIGKVDINLSVYAREKN